MGWSHCPQLSPVGWSHCPHLSPVIPSGPQWDGHTVLNCPQLSPVAPSRVGAAGPCSALCVLGGCRCDPTDSRLGWRRGLVPIPACLGSQMPWVQTQLDPPQTPPDRDCWAPGRAWGGLGGSVCPPGDTLTLCCVPQFGAIRVRCLFTPCHTSGHMCYFMWEDDSPDAPALFSGIPPCPRAPHGFWGHSPCVLPVGEPSTPVPQVTPCSWGAAGSSSRAQQSRCTPTSPKSWALCPRTR